MKFLYTKEKAKDLKEQLELSGGGGKDGIDVTNETIKNQKTGLDTKIWIGTQSEYDALTTKDSDTLYIKAFDSSEVPEVPEVPVEPSGDMGLAKDYSGIGWYKATDTGTVFSKGVPALEKRVFEEGGLEYVSVHTKEDAKLYGERAATSNVTNMLYCFFIDDSFNQDISSWDVSSVTDMGFMFYGATSFNQDISSWDVSKVTNMNEMFSGCSSFNQDLSGWCMTHITFEPRDFSLGNTVWTLPKPVWGTCPRGENTP